MLDSTDAGERLAAINRRVAISISAMGGRGGMSTTTSRRNLDLLKVRSGLMLPGAKCSNRGEPGK